MFWPSRKRKQLESDLDDEIAFDLAKEAAEKASDGLSKKDSCYASRRDFGNVLRIKEDIREAWRWTRLERLAQDVRYGWRQINKHRTVSAAAVLSLALAVGAAAVAFRLIDALILRPLPIAQPERFFYLAQTFVDRDGRPDYRDDFDYPSFRRYRDALASRADVMVIGGTSRQEGVFDSSGEAEKFYRQYLSGNAFETFGLTPALGRLFTPHDDSARPIAVLSYSYWARRFASDPQVVGKTFRYAGNLYEIIGVGPRGFIGTEPGIIPDVFIPATMNAEALNSPGWSWFRMWVRPKPGVKPAEIRQTLRTMLSNEHRQQMGRFNSDTPRSVIDAFLNESILLLPAGSGVSSMQRQYRRPLAILAGLVALVLLVAIANVGNLLAAQSAARAREMALRVSIGAGKGRLIQLVLIESLLLALLASTAGALFSWWAAPFVVSLLAPAQDPVRIVLDAGWRLLAFSAGLTILLALAFGLAPALRASAVRPVSALKGGDDPVSRQRLMNSLIAGQMALCVLVLFVAGLFVATFSRLLTKPLGFSYRGILAMESQTKSKKTTVSWLELLARLRQSPGVESAAFAGWPLLTANTWTMTVRAPNRAATPRAPYVLDVSPGFFETMRIRFLAGRDFRAGDRQGKIAIVNEAFARVYFDGANPVGGTVLVRAGKENPVPIEIVGYVGNAAYSNVREDFRPTLYVPILDRNGDALLVRAAGDPVALAATMRRAVKQADPDLQIRNIEAETDLVRRQMIRERLLASLSAFFAAVALVLAALGLYGVLNYSVLRQRREIGIRMALGAASTHVIRSIGAATLGLVGAGAIAGLAGGLAGARLIQTLLYEVKATDAPMIALPVLTLLFAAALAALPPLIRAVRTDPARTLRSE